jgi:hypothetical protein
MNERIKQLLNQATTDALYETKDAVDFLDNPVSKQQRELQLEKFAELIVNECLTICEELGDKGMDGHYCADRISRIFRS